MIKIFTLLSLYCIFIYGAEFLDDDLDGVENQFDKCPNSLMTDIVDKYGCTVKKISYPTQQYADISIGYGYNKLDDNNSQTSLSLSLGYYYGNFGIYFYTSNYELDTSENGIDDTTLEFNYKFIDNTFIYYVGAGLYFPTLDIRGNETDYFLRLQAGYYLEKIDFSLDYQYTFMQDDYTQNTSRIIFSSGYTINDKLYTALSYTNQNSIYKYEQNLENISIYINYSINNNLFSSISASKGLSNSASDASIYFNIGYSF